MRGSIRWWPLAAVMPLLLGPVSSGAATPSSGTVALGQPVSWDTPQLQGVAQANNPGTGVKQVDQACQNPKCDSFALTIQLPTDAPTYYRDHQVTVAIAATWNSTQPTDMDVFAIDAGGNQLGPGNPDTDVTGPSHETLSLGDPVAGQWTVNINAYDSALPTAVHVVATMTSVLRPPLPPAPPAPRPGDPTFTNFAAPSAVDGATGEPSIGVDVETGVAMVQSGVKTDAITFDDSTNPATAKWTEVDSPITGTVTQDPIGFLDQHTHRYFASELLSNASCSAVAYTDNDGANWSPSQGCGPQSGSDHQTVGGGPYPPGVGPSASSSYQDAVWYCSQEGTDAKCSLSQDGGTTFGVATAMYTAVTCGGLHGHLRVGPDGTAYVPNKSCVDANQVVHRAVAVSTDGNVTWKVKDIPGSTDRYGSSDPSVAVGPRGTIYYGYQDGDGHAKVTVSRDHGDSWTTPIDVGSRYFIQNTQFAEVITGDDNRAAFAFLGSATAGDDQAADFGCRGSLGCVEGTWHLYVALTYDGGATWATVDATPSGPMQRGCIWNEGGSNPCRNLLDFNDITVDKQGRVLVVYTDGCVDACRNTIYADQTKIARSVVTTVARQQCGRGLYAANDPGFSCSVALPVAAPPPVTTGAALPNTSMSPSVRWPAMPWEPLVPAACLAMALRLPRLLRYGRRRPPSGLLTGARARR
ncbi:MAG: sialidase family protein [Candidatus Dormibacteria bacterium]